MKLSSFSKPTVVSPEQWLAARRELLREEKAFTQQRERLTALRRALPWVKVTQPYTFDSPVGRVSLADLFEGRSQLMVYHFMLGAGWEEGCKSCSLIADSLNPAVVHLQARDVTVAVISHAPFAEIAPFKARMGWDFAWVSAAGSTFNHDFHVSFTPEERAKGAVYYNYAQREFPHEEAPGLSVFARGADGAIYHTYSTYGRGLEALIGVYTYLDLVPKGRDEEGLDYGMEWVRHHDRYEHTLVAS